MTLGIALWRGGGLAAGGPGRKPQLTWRRRARAAIVAVVDDFPLDDMPTDILARVDAAYPFGVRAHHPYKAWLHERRLFIEALGPAEMGRDEVAACLVAQDLMEDSGGAPDPALLAALLASAPNRHAKKCLACGAKAGQPCRDIQQVNPIDPLYGCAREADRVLLVPHHARLVGHVDAGPLFTPRSP